MIKVLLQVNPKRRPSCNEILQMPIIEKKIQEFGFEEYKNTNLAANTLLGTIQIPRNLCVLRDKLPKPNYGNKEEKETPGPTFGYFARRNKSTKDNRSRRRLIDSGNSIIKNEYSIGHNLQNIVRSSQLKNLDLSTSDSNKRVNESTNERKEFKLPDIKKGAAPIKRLPPRVRYNKVLNEDENIHPYNQLRLIEGKAELADPYSENAKLIKLYEEINRRKMGYNPLPSYSPPVSHSPYCNKNNECKRPIVVQPSWWG